MCLVGVVGGDTGAEGVLTFEKCKQGLHGKDQTGLGLQTQLGWRE